MIGRFFLVFSTVFILLSCSEGTDSEFTYYPNGHVEREIRTINDSTQVSLSYFEAGGIKDSITMIKGKIAGQNKKYYSNGNLEKDCFWKGGLLNGPCSSYYQSGNLKDMINYESNINVGDVYEYFDLPGKRIQYKGNYSRVRGKKWVNYQTWYDSLGRVKKATVGIHEINGAKVVTLKDSLKVTFEMENLEYPLLRVFISDYDDNYNLSSSSVPKVFIGTQNTIVVYITPVKLGKQVARGTIQNYKVIEKFKDGKYKTKGKDIYWSYDYEVKPK